MGAIGSLLCGNSQANGLAKDALSQLSSSIDNFSDRAVRFLSSDLNDDTLTFGPFCARVLLENGCAALMGRLDSFRMLYLSEFQSQPEYEHGKRAKSAFSWTGDVIPDERPSNTLWSVDHDLSKISRALFSKHIEHIYWKPAVEEMLDFVSSMGTIDAHISEILELDAETFIGSTKGKSVQLYSTLSKGVHWEFFSSALLFDEATVKTMIRDTLVLVSQLGLASHFIPTAYASLSPDEAVDFYLTFRKALS